MKRKGIIMLAAALCTALFASAAMADESTLKTAIEAGGNVQMSEDIALTDELIIENDVTLDLAGYKLSRSGANSATYVIRVRNDATLTINDSVGGGSIESTTTGNQTGRCIIIGDGTNGGTVIMNAGTLIADYREPVGSVYGGQAVRLQGNTSAEDQETSVTAVFTMKGGKIQAGMGGVVAFGKTSTVNIEGGEIESYAYAISGNGTNNSTENYGGTVINISGGTLTSKMTSAIYQPQAGTIEITGGTVTGYDGIQMKAGTLIMSGGTLEGTGAFNDDYTYEEGQHDGTIATGAALALLSEGNTEETGYAGNITVKISGNAVLRSADGYALAEAYSNYEEGAINKFVGLTIEGGTFIGAEDKTALVMTNAGDISGERGYTEITGGTFSSELSACDGLKDLTNLPQMTQDENGNFVAVTTPAETLEIVSDSLEVAVGKTLQLKAVMTPEGANDKVVWSSSDEAIATVDQNGLVTGVSIGNVTIKGTITHTDSALKDLESSLEIAVVAATTSDDVKPQPSGSGGGGCSAGFGALALLAALPLLRMRKK